MTDQPRSPARDADAPHDEGEAPQQPRRLPGEPHPYMLQRNPPNLWILFWMTVGSLVAAVAVIALTVIL